MHVFTGLKGLQRESKTTDCAVWDAWAGAVQDVEPVGRRSSRGRDSVGLEDGSAQRQGKAAGEAAEHKQGSGSRKRARALVSS